ncbi:MAG: hypothetical protein IPL41_14650 [Micropruina sp.]|nr:hypothetical protein [Micropruina sp.]
MAMELAENQRTRLDQRIVIPANAGISPTSRRTQTPKRSERAKEIPAFAGMTGRRDDETPG